MPRALSAGTRVLRRAKEQQLKSSDPVTVRRRRDIAKLLWELRALKRGIQECSQIADRLARLKREIGPAFRYVYINVAPGAAPGSAVVRFGLDKELLRQAEAC